MTDLEYVELAARRAHEKTLFVYAAPYDWQVAAALRILANELTAAVAERDALTRRTAP